MLHEQKSIDSVRTTRLTRQCPDPEGVIGFGVRVPNRGEALAAPLLPVVTIVCRHGPAPENSMCRYIDTHIALFSGRLKTRLRPIVHGSPYLPRPCCHCVPGGVVLPAPCPPYLLSHAILHLQTCDNHLQLYYFSQILPQSSRHSLL